MNSIKLREKKIKPSQQTIENIQINKLKSKKKSTKEFIEYLLQSHIVYNNE